MFSLLGSRAGMHLIRRQQQYMGATLFVPSATIATSVPSQATGYSLFAKNELEEGKGDHSLTGLKKANQFRSAWKELDTASQKPFNDKAQLENALASVKKRSAYAFFPFNMPEGSSIGAYAKAKAAAWADLGEAGQAKVQNDALEEFAKQQAEFVDKWGAMSAEARDDFEKKMKQDKAKRKAKRKATARGMFRTEFFANLKANGETLPIEEGMAEFNRAWSNLDESDKQMWQESADSENDRKSESE